MSRKGIYTGTKEHKEHGTDVIQRKGKGELYQETARKARAVRTSEKTLK